MDSLRKLHRESKSLLEGLGVEPDSFATALYLVTLGGVVLGRTELDAREWLVTDIAHYFLGVEIPEGSKERGKLWKAYDETRLHWIDNRTDLVATTLQFALALQFDSYDRASEHKEQLSLCAGRAIASATISGHLAPDLGPREEPEPSGCGVWLLFPLVGLAATAMHEASGLYS